MAQLSIRVRTTKGVLSICDLKASEASSSLYDVVYRLCKERKTRIKKNGFDLLFGFPPRVLENSSELTLVAAGLRAGETLLVRDKNSTKAEAAQAKSSESASPDATYKGTFGKSKSRPRKSNKRAIMPKRNAPSPTSELEKRVYVRKGNSMKNKEDIAERLINATKKWCHKDPVEKFLKKAQRLAVKKQYEIEEGNKRYAAALSGDYEFTVVARKLNGVGSHYKIKYKAGHTGRSYNEDEIVLIDEALVIRTLHNILGSEDDLDDEVRKERRENLKPYFIAEISPQMFWSLVHSIGREMSFKEGLCRLLPGVNWDFIEIRHRKKSEKAKEALANEEYAKSLRRSKRQKSKNNNLDKPSLKVLEGLPAWLPHDLVTSIHQSQLTMLQLGTLSGTAREKLVSHYAKNFIDTKEKTALEVANLQLEAWIDRVQKHLSTEMVESTVMPCDEIRAKIKELLEAETVYDYTRLKVPGRIEVISEQLRHINEIESKLWAAQKTAESLLKEHSFLSEFRTRG